MDSLAQSAAAFALPVIFAITLHEAAHAYAARHFGDLTAWRQGRVSLNPLRHIDPVGTILVPLAILLLTRGSFVFGWARPVPVNFGALRDPRRDMRWVAAAGPLANLGMLLAWTGLLKLVLSTGGSEDGLLADMARAGMVTNVLFMLFNMLPILPLDGGRVLCSLLPDRLAASFARLERFGFPILFGMVLLGQLGFNIIGHVLTPLALWVLALASVLFRLPDF